MRTILSKLKVASVVVIVVGTVIGIYSNATSIALHRSTVARLAKDVGSEPNAAELGEALETLVSSLVESNKLRATAALGHWVFVAGVLALSIMAVLDHGTAPADTGSVLRRTHVVYIGVITALVLALSLQEYSRQRTQDMNADLAASLHATFASFMSYRARSITADPVLGAEFKKLEQKYRELRALREGE